MTLHGHWHSLLQVYLAGLYLSHQEYLARLYPYRDVCALHCASTCLSANFNMSLCTVRQPDAACVRGWFDWSGI